MNKNQLFLRMYNELDALLRIEYKMNDRDESAVARYERSLRLPKANNIRLIREMRNTLTHNTTNFSMNAFEVSDDTIKFLQSVIDEFKNPKKAYDICVLKSKLLFATLTTKSKDIIDAMVEKGFSHIPVLDEKENLLGVFSETTIFSFLGVYDKIILNDESTINDFINFIPLDNHIHEKFIFVAKNCYLKDLVNLFEENQNKKKRLVMIFVTQNGNVNEKILGILTPWDILREIGHENL